MRRTLVIRSEAASLQTSKGRALSLQQSSGFLDSSTQDVPHSKYSIFKDDLDHFLSITQDEDFQRTKADDYREHRLKSTSFLHWKWVFQVTSSIRTADIILEGLKKATLLRYFCFIRRQGCGREPSIETYYRKKMLLKVLTGWSQVMVTKYHELDIIATPSPKKKQRTVKIAQVNSQSRLETMVSFGDNTGEFKEIYTKSRFNRRILRKVLDGMKKFVKNRKELYECDRKLRELRVVKRVFGLWLGKQRKYRGFKSMAAFFACYKLQKAFVNWRSGKGNGKVLSVEKAKLKLGTLSDEDLILEIAALEKTLETLQGEIGMERQRCRGGG